MQIGNAIPQMQCWKGYSTQHHAASEYETSAALDPGERARSWPSPLIFRGRLRRCGTDNAGEPCHRANADVRPHTGHHLECKIDIAREIDAMIGADRYRNDPVRIIHGPNPGDRVPDPGQAEPTRTEQGFIAGNGSHLPAILAMEDIELGPEVSAGDTVSRRAHFDDEGGRLPAQRFGKVGRKIAGYRDTVEPCLHLGSAGDRVDRRTHRVRARDRAGLRDRAGGEAKRYCGYRSHLDCKDICPYMV